MNWYYYLGRDEAIFRVKCRARPASYNVPMKSKKWDCFLYTRSVINPWDQRGEFSLKDLKELDYIGWTKVEEEKFIHQRY